MTTNNRPATALPWHIGGDNINGQGVLASDNGGDYVALTPKDDDAEWMATLVKLWGDEGAAYFRKLAAMKPDMRKGHVLLAQLVAALRNVAYPINSAEAYEAQERAIALLAELGEES